MKIFLTITFSLLLPFAVLAQPDQWKKTLESDLPDSVKFMACIDLHNYYFKDNPDQSLLYSQKGLQLATQIKSDPLLLKAYQMLARCARKQRDYNKVVGYDLKALDQTRKLKQADAEFHATIMLARDNLDGERKKEGYKWLKQCETLADRSKKPDQLAVTNQTLGYYYNITDQHKQAITYFTKAIDAYTQLGNAYKVAETKIFLVESMIKIGDTKNAPAYLFDAIETFKTGNNTARLAYTYQELGTVFMTNGDITKGIGYYKEAKDLYKKSNNDVEQALVIPDIVRGYLLLKDYAAAETYINEASSLFEQEKYDIGRTMVSTLRGQLYSEKGEWEKADQHFIWANNMARQSEMQDLKLENDKQWAIHRYRQKRLKEADSLTYAYARNMVAHKSPETIAIELEMIKQRNKGADSNMLKLLSVLYSPGGPDKIKELLHDKTLGSVLNIDSLLKLNPYTNASPGFDSSMTAAYNKQFLELETQYKTKQIADSLQNQQKENIITRQNLQKRNYLLLGAGLLLLLAILFAAQQVRNRKRAERDREYISMLQHEVHHRVKNNLAVINRLVDVAGKNSVDEVPLSALKNRIKSIELLHKHLYNQKIRPGYVSLQSYIEDLSTNIATTFETAKNIQINIDAQVEVKSEIAEKLGLIITELMTNSYKYAFDDKELGAIDIHINKTAANTIEMVQQDNGKGFNVHTIPGNYGMKLIKGLSHQLDGKFSFETSNGTLFRLTVPA